MPKIICEGCQVQFKTDSIGIAVIETFNRPPEPYKLWSADLLTCPGCGRRIVAGFPEEPYAVHFEPDFADKLAEALAGRHVYDFERPGDAAVGKLKAMAAAREAKDHD